MNINIEKYNTYDFILEAGTLIPEFYSKIYSHGYAAPHVQRYLCVHHKTLNFTARY